MNHNNIGNNNANNNNSRPPSFPHDLPANLPPHVLQMLFERQQQQQQQQQFMNNNGHNNNNSNNNMKVNMNDNMNNIANFPGGVSFGNNLAGMMNNKNNQNSNQNSIAGSNGKDNILDNDALMQQLLRQNSESMGGSPFMNSSPLISAEQQQRPMSQQQMAVPQNSTQQQQFMNKQQPQQRQPMNISPMMVGGNIPMMPPNINLSPGMNITGAPGVPPFNMPPHAAMNAANNMIKNNNYGNMNNNNNISKTNNLKNNAGKKKSPKVTAGKTVSGKVTKSNKGKARSSKKPLQSSKQPKEMKSQTPVSASGNTAVEPSKPLPPTFLRPKDVILEPFYFSRNKKEVTTDALIYEQVTFRDEKHLEALKQVKPNTINKEISFYNKIKNDRMDSIKMAAETNVTTFTKNIWGDGFQGFGNGFSNGSTRLVYPSERKRPTRLRDLYFTRDEWLIQSGKKEELVPIRLEFDVEKDKFRLRDTFLWNRNESLITLEHFVAQMMNDYKFSNPMYTDTVLTSIKEQLAEYDTFPTPKFKSDSPPTSAASEEEMRIMIKLDITVSNHRLLDEFEWDLMNPDNNPEEFAEVLCAELQLPGEFVTSISHSIREQCQIYFKSLYLTGFSFQKSNLHEEIKQYVLPNITTSNWLKLNEQSLELDNPNATAVNNLSKLNGPTLYELSYLDLEKLDKDRERELRRKRRNNGRTNNRRGIPNLPDLNDVPKTFRTPVPSTTLPGGINLGPSADGCEETYIQEKEPSVKLIVPGQMSSDDESMNENVDNNEASTNTVTEEFFDVNIEGTIKSENNENSKVHYIHEPGRKMLIIIKI